MTLTLTLNISFDFKANFRPFDLNDLDLDLEH